MTSHKTLLTIIGLLIALDVITLLAGLIFSKKRWAVLGHLLIEILGIVIYFIAIGITNMIDSKPLVWAIATISLQVYFIWGRISTIRFGEHI